MNELEALYVERLEKQIQEKGVSNEFLISLLKPSETYLNLKRVSDYATEINQSTQWVRKSRPVVKICDYQLIIDNE